MKLASLTTDIIYNEERVAVTVLLDTDFGKEIRIVFRKGQLMKEHKAPFPIVVEVFEGAIDFGVNKEISHLQRGDLIALDSNIPHDLRALEDSIVRLSLNKSDTIGRVEKVVN